MSYVSPYSNQPSLRDRLSELVVASPALALQPPGPSTNEGMARDGCIRCSAIAVCANNAVRHPNHTPKDTIKELAQYEEGKFSWNKAQNILDLEDHQKRQKKLRPGEFLEIDVEEGPFCCGDLKICGRQSTMKVTDPKYGLVKKFLDALKEGDHFKISIKHVSQRRLPQVVRVYKVNLYGPLVPFDAHSTWLFLNSADHNPEDPKDVYWAFMYCETLQPFSSVTPYLSVACNEDHRGQRNYRVGVYDAKWVVDKDGKRSIGTFGDTNLDAVMGMPCVPRITLGYQQINSGMEAFLREPEETEDVGIN